VNRILRQLSERGLLTLRDSQVTFHDLPHLRLLAGHQYLPMRPRNRPN
jgi:hypothetical protein